ncbi:MAG TPA: SRPBCC family protein [Mucilaginibacter sp.]
MNEQSYTATIVVANTPVDVFDHITEVPKWWSTDFEGSSKKVHDVFVICHPGQHYSKQELTEVIPGKKVVWLVTESKLNWLTDKAEWTNTKMVFEITAKGEMTELKFTHDGLVPALECYGKCSQGWDTVIKNWLFNFITSPKEVSGTTRKVSYSTHIEVPFPPDFVFEHVNDVAKWWPEEFEGNSVKLNDEFTFSSGDTHTSKQRIIEFVPDRKVVWLITESLRKTDNYEWTGAKMTFELAPTGDTTIVTYTYDGPVFENEYGRLIQLCDMVIKEKLYNFITEGSDQKPGKTK